jgi:hypothetical protein
MFEHTLHQRRVIDAAFKHVAVPAHHPSVRQQAFRLDLDPLRAGAVIADRVAGTGWATMRRRLPVAAAMTDDLALIAMKAEWYIAVGAVLDITT